jgi:hypothetical protein
MKFIRFFLVMVFVFGLLGLSSSNTQGQTFASYVSGITLQNLSNQSASVSVNYYDQNGAIIHSTSDNIAAFGVKDYATIPAPAGFNGSVVISSDRSVGAVSTLRGDNRGRGAYIGASTGATEINLPILMKNWGSSRWNTWFAVQNIDTSDATVEVNYASCAGSVNDSATIKPGAMKTFNQATAACMGSNPVLTSGIVRSTNAKNLAVIVAQESSVVNAGLVSSGFPAGSTNPVVPLMNSNNPNTTGWRTAISIFNQGNSSTNVTLTYIKTDGSSCTETQTIASKQAKVFGGNNLITGAPAGVTLTCGVGQRVIGSAYVSANSTSQPLVATVNQDRGGLASAYGAIARTVGTPKVFFPQIQDRNGASSQWASSLMIFNAGTGNVYVKCTFANTSYTATSGVLGPNRAWEDLQRGKISAGYVGSGECTAYTNSSYNVVATTARILGVANVRGTGDSFDLMMSYEGVNTAP